jgi:excisionase family DNA binding protein
MKPTPINRKDLLTIDEVCAYLQVSKSTFNKWRMTERAPRCHRFPNGSLRIRQADLDEWIDSQAEENVA